MYFDRESTQLHNVSRTRSVYLPSGFEWCDFWTGEMWEGGQTITVKAPLEIMPLFVRAGSIIPMGPLTQHTGEGLNEPLELRVYPGSNGSFAFYEDEGDSYNYEKGAFAITNIAWDDDAKEITFEKKTGVFEGQATYMRFNIVLVSKEHGVGLDEALSPDKVVDYTGEKCIINLALCKCFDRDLTNKR